MIMSGTYNFPFVSHVRNLSIVGGPVGLQAYAGMYGGTVTFDRVSISAPDPGGVGILLTGSVCNVQLTDSSVNGHTYGVYASQTNYWVQNFLSLTRTSVSSGYGYGIMSAVAGDLNVNATDSTIQGPSGAIFMTGKLGQRGYDALNLTNCTVYCSGGTGPNVTLGDGNSMTAFRNIFVNGTVDTSGGGTARLVDCRDGNLDPIP
jgi:hypothetical protein